MAQDAEQGTSRDWGKQVLANEFLRVEVLPALGGKISSITLAGEGGELLQGPLKPYEPRSASLPFDQGDGGGWDECLPSVGPCTVSYGAGRSARIEDHGDLWRAAWTVDAASETGLRMHVEATSLPLSFERTLRLEGRVLHCDYTLRNGGDEPVPYGWSVHPLFGIYPFDRIHLPPSVREVTVGSSANGRLGAAGTRQSWPQTTSSLDGQPLDLSLAGALDDGVADKLVMPSPAEGWVALERKTLRTMLTLHFDPAAAPFLGLWLCYGGWPADPQAKKGFTVALEPCNLPADSLADSLGQGGGRLAPGEQRQWSLRLEVSDVEER